jgi:oxygen-dependent protoporphyrinogen oxidase
VAFYTGANITKLEPHSSTIEWIDAGGAAQRIKYDGLVLTTGAIGAAALLGISLLERGFDAPISHHLLHFRLAQTNNSSLCYLYSLDPDYDWYRITNYRAFSGDPNDCRLTVEVLGRPLPDEEHAQSILAGLARIGFLTSKHAELIDALTLPSGFPTPTTRSLQAMSRLGKEVRAQIPSNILLGGIGAQPSQFFQNEVVYDIYSRVEGFVEALNG